MAEQTVEPRPEARSAERAFVLTATTLVLLTPPILTIFDVPVAIFGVPLLHIYCFAVWLAAIAAGAWLAPRMGGGSPPAGGNDSGAGPGAG